MASVIVVILRTGESAEICSERWYDVVGGGERTAIEERMNAHMFYHLAGIVTHCNNGLASARLEQICKSQTALYQHACDLIDRSSRLDAWRNLALGSIRVHLKGYELFVTTETEKKKHTYSDARYVCISNTQSICGANEIYDVPCKPSDGKCCNISFSPIVRKTNKVRIIFVGNGQFQDGNIRSVVRYIVPESYVDDVKMKISRTEITIEGAENVQQFHLFINDITNIGGVIFFAEGDDTTKVTLFTKTGDNRHFIINEIVVATAKSADSVVETH